MARVYASRLGAYHGLGGGLVPLASPPAGFLWVVRHMTAMNTGPATGPLDGFSIVENGQESLWTLSGPIISVGQTYDWSGRHVLVEADSWSFNSGDLVPWQLVIGGYQLQLP